MRLRAPATLKAMVGELGRAGPARGVGGPSHRRARAPLLSPRAPCRGTARAKVDSPSPSRSSGWQFAHISAPGDQLAALRRGDAGEVKNALLIGPIEALRECEAVEEKMLPQLLRRTRVLPGQGTCTMFRARGGRGRLALSADNVAYTNRPQTTPTLWSKGAKFLLTFH